MTMALLVVANALATNAIMQNKCNMTKIIIDASCSEKLLNPMLCVIPVWYIHFSFE